MSLADIHNEMIQALIEDKRGFFIGMSKAAGSEPDAEALESIGKDTIFVLPMKCKAYELPHYCEFSPHIEDSFILMNEPDVQRVPVMH